MTKSFGCCYCLFHVAFDRAGFLAGEIDVSVGHTSLLGDAMALAAPTRTTTAQERLSVSAVVEDTLDIGGILSGEKPWQDWKSGLFTAHYAPV